MGSCTYCWLVERKLYSRDVTRSFVVMFHVETVNLGVAEK